MKRLDQALVDLGLCDSREKAKRSILAGEVRVNEQVARKASDTVRPADVVTLAVRERFVSRGGWKLDHALQHFHIKVAGKAAIDLGASTGGFTDCLLQAGAVRVYAIDVGQGQLAWKLRQDPRVGVMERTNARHVTPRHFPEGALPVPLIVVDCSFISLRQILPSAISLLDRAGEIVALIKPQFEAGKAEADRGAGVISDPAVHERVIRELEQFATAELRLLWRGVTQSPLLGPAGNKEFLVHLEKTE